MVQFFCIVLQSQENTVSLVCVLLAASQLAVLWPSWNWKDINHLSCCQRTLWVSEIFVLWVRKRDFRSLCLHILFCFHLIISYFIFINFPFVSHSSQLSVLQSWAVQTKGAGAQCLWWKRHPGCQREGQELCSAYRGWDPPRVSQHYLHHMCSNKALYSSELPLNNHVNLKSISTEMPLSEASLTHLHNYTMSEL